MRWWWKNESTFSLLNGSDSPKKKKSNPTMFHVPYSTESLSPTYWKRNSFTPTLSPIQKQKHHSETEIVAQKSFYLFYYSFFIIHLKNKLKNCDSLCFSLSLSVALCVFISIAWKKKLERERERESDFFGLKMIDFGRVQKELQECSRDMASSGIKVSPKSDNLARLVGTIPGPIGTPYEGGTFQIDISLPGPNFPIFHFFFGFCVSFQFFVNFVMWFFF